MSAFNGDATHDVPDHKDGREVEWQLASSDLAPVRRWLVDHGTIDGLTVESCPTLQIFDTYFDTPDWRIFRAGFALRIRVESGRSQATLKSLKSARADVADRREVSESLLASGSGSIRLSGGPVGSRVHAVSGVHELRPLFEVNTSRQRFSVRRAGEPRMLGEIALDETAISRPRGAVQTTLQRVEVESLTQTHESLETLVKVLSRDCGLEIAADSKYSQGLKSVGLVPPQPLQGAPVAIDATMRLDEIALVNLRRYMTDWHLQEPAARLGDDPEGLHDLRVAGRKLDATVRQFRPCLPAQLLRIRPTIKKVLRALGEARDYDVALNELETFNQELPESDRVSLEPLKRHLLAQRLQSRAHMLSVLDSVSVQRDFAKMESLLVSGTTPAVSAELATVVAPELIRRRYRKMLKGAKRLTPESSMEAYHAVRGRVKKLRYALEALAVIYGKPADEMLKALRRWQERLGVQQDANVAGKRLRALALAPPEGIPPETLFLMGRQAEHYSATAMRARKGHEKAFKNVRKRWKALKAKLQDRGDSSEWNC